MISKIALFKLIIINIYLCSNSDDKQKYDPLSKIDVYLKKFESKIVLSAHCSISLKDVIILSKNGNLYKSKDYGKTWLNSSQELKNIFSDDINITNFIQNPLDLNHFIFINSDGTNFYTFDCLNSVKILSEDIMLDNFLIHPFKKEYILAKTASNCKLNNSKCKAKNDLYYTKDQGLNWNFIKSNIIEYIWAKEADYSYLSSLYRIFYIEESDKNKLYYSDNFMNVTDIVYSDVSQFVMTKNYIFIETTKKNENGDKYFITSTFGFFYHLNPIQLNQIPDENYQVTVLDTKMKSFGYIVVSVDYNGIKLYSLYYSDSFTSKYELVLENLVCEFEYANCEFNTVESLEGVIVANVYDDKAINKIKNFGPKSNYYKGSNSNLYDTISKNIYTVISYDFGKSWAKIKAPKKDADNNPINCSNCNLNLFLNNSKQFKSFEGIKFSPSAPGIILCQGSISRYLDTNNKERMGLFLSTDGGITFKQIMKGKLIYDFVDQGGFIITAEKNKLTKNMKISYDLGDTWKNIIIAEKDIKVNGFDMGVLKDDHKFLVIGHTIENYINKGDIITVDLTGFHERDCVHSPNKEKSDYEEFRPYSFYNNNISKCFNGREIVYLRKKKNRLCYNNDKFELFKIKRFCECTEDDWHCDFGYYRNDASECVPIKDFKDVKYSIVNYHYKNADITIPKNCNGYYFKSSGYKKNYNTNCSGGIEHYGKEVKCLSTFDSDNNINIFSGIIYLGCNLIKYTVYIAILGIILFGLYKAYEKISTKNTISFNKEKFKNYLNIGTIKNHKKRDDDTVELNTTKYKEIGNDFEDEELFKEDEEDNKIENKLEEEPNII